MIEVQGLEHAYREKVVLDGVTFRVADGEVVGYLGPNGAGKTTTLRVLLGMLRPKAGDVRVCGLDPMAEPERVRALVGYVPESGAVYETLTPVEHLTLVGRLHGLSEDVVAARARELLDAFGLVGGRPFAAGASDGTALPCYFKSIAMASNHPMSTCLPSTTPRRRASPQ